MSIFEYDEELHLRTVREEGYEDGVADGYEHGKIDGYEHGKTDGYEHGKIDGYENGVSQTTSEIIRNMFKNNFSPEVISQCTAQPLEYIYQIGEELNTADSQAVLREDIKYGNK
jgi:flagellar biosynthesis/type III secretory pathway protein FliH